MKYKIKNWGQFQQYKDNRPLHWIKLHTKILKDFRFSQLSELSQLHLVKLWLLAAENHGIFEGDSLWLARIIGAKKIDLDELVQAGYLIRTESYESVPREEEREKRREEENNVTLKRDPVGKIFTYWQEKLNHPGAALDDKRRAVIRKALKTHSVEKLKSAIDGCAADSWHMGKNDRGKVYDGVNVIFKDADKIESFINGQAKPPKTDLRQWSANGNMIIDEEGKRVN